MSDRTKFVLTVVIAVVYLCVMLLMMADTDTSWRPYLLYATIFYASAVFWLRRL